MLQHDELDAALRALLPSEFGDVVPILSRIIIEREDLGNITGSDERRLSFKLQSALRLLAGKEAVLERHTVSFGSDSQMGDVSIGSIVEGDSYNLSITFQNSGTQQIAPLIINNYHYAQPREEPLSGAGAQQHRTISQSSFPVGKPVTDVRLFFGREKEVRRIFSLLRPPSMQNIAIIGPRRSGKTSLLYFLKSIVSVPRSELRQDQYYSWLPNLASYKWVYIDFQDPRLGTRNGVIRHVLRGLDLPIPSNCDLDDFLDITSRFVRTPTIVLLDEIGVAIERYPELDNVFWESLRHLCTMEVGGNLSFVLASHNSPDKIALHKGMSSPFFNIFGYSALLGPLTNNEASLFLDNSMINFSEQERKWVMETSQGWPILLNLLCQHKRFSLEEGDSTDRWQVETEPQLAVFKRSLGIA